MRKFGKRAIVAAVAGAVGVAAAGVAWAAWQSGGSGTATAASTQRIRVETVATTTPGTTPGTRLYPGGTGTATITIRNRNPYPVRVEEIVGTGEVFADDPHRLAGCRHTGVTIDPDAVVPWVVPAGETREFTLPGAAAMAPDSDNACQGATFFIPVAIFARSTT